MVGDVSDTSSDRILGFDTFKQKVRVGDFIEKKTGIAFYTIKKPVTGEIINFKF